MYVPKTYKKNVFISEISNNNIVVFVVQIRIPLNKMGNSDKWYMAFLTNFVM